MEGRGGVNHIRHLHSGIGLAHNVRTVVIDNILCAGACAEGVLARSIGVRAYGNGVAAILAVGSHIHQVVGVGDSCQRPLYSLGAGAGQHSKMAAVHSLNIHRAGLVIVVLQCLPHITQRHVVAVEHTGIGNALGYEDLRGVALQRKGVADILGGCPGKGSVCLKGIHADLTQLLLGHIGGSHGDRHQLVIPSLGVGNDTFKFRKILFGGCRLGLGGSITAAGRKERQHRHHCQQKGNQLFHSVLPPVISISKRY